jgi:RNA polymerase sigma factor (sigma-70 family)
MSPFYPYAWRLTHNREEALDLIQDTYIVGMRYWGKEQAASADFEPRFIGLMRRLWITTCFRRKNHPALLSLTSVPPLAVPGDAFQRVDLRLQLEEAWRQLTDIQREALTLVFLEQRTGPEAARLLGIEVKTIYSRIKEARKKLRNLSGEPLL